MILNRVVVVSRDAEIHNLARQVGQQLFVADDVAEVLDLTRTIKPDLAILDRRYDTEHTGSFTKAKDKFSPDIPVVIVSKGQDESRPSKTAGLADNCHHLHSVRDIDKLRQIASGIRSKAAADNTRPGEDWPFANELASSVNMVGRSKAMLKTLELIELVASSRCNPILITGETGTGKELAVRAIHSLRHPGKPFVAINCAAVTSTLLESELFGHVRGSFTGADREKTGLMELAADGTLLLDEISEMPMDLQSKLLRVFQEKTFRKVGGTEELTCRATIITSSNRNLYKEALANRFRKDLHYRLNICPITIAPLRADSRKEDIRLLAEYFLKTSTICPQKTNKIKTLTNLAIEALEKHDWPGNVRELHNVIERAILLETTDKIGLCSIAIEPTGDDYPTSCSITNQNSQVTDFSLAKAERGLIARALQETGWQKTRAAALLGITRATLYAKVKQYNIEKDPPGAQGENQAGIPASVQPIAVA